VTGHFAGHTVVSALGGLAASSLALLSADPAVAGVVAVRTGELAVASGVPGFPEIPGGGGGS
jgi:hypothetical protein